MSSTASAAGHLTSKWLAFSQYNTKDGFSPVYGVFIMTGSTPGGGVDQTRNTATLPEANQ